MIDLERKVVYTDLNGNPNPLNYEHLDVWIKADLALNTNSDVYFRTADAKWKKIVND